MKVVLFGANGRVGTLVTQKLLDDGFQVRACIHGDTFRVPSNENLEVMQVNIHNQASVENAIVTADIVMSTLGSWGTPTKDILEQAMKHIIPAMQKNNILRIITLTGADARAQGDKIGIVHALMHFFIRFSPAKKILEDGERHIKLLENSQLDWTTLRSPVMNEKGVEDYTLTTKRPKPWQTIHRQAVVTALVDEVNNTSQIKKAPFLHR